MISNNGKIPFLDLVTLHEELEAELVPVFQKVLRTAGFVGGPMVEEFEREFAAFTGASHCVGLASGTDAVRFALMAAGVQPGDIVLTVPHTFIATTEGISQAGARPDFVDIEEPLIAWIPRSCRNISRRNAIWIVKPAGPTTGNHARRSPRSFRCISTDRPRTWIRILELARRYNLIVVEDACQAHGAEYFSKKENRWRKAGTMGHAAAFSFYPGKNLGACGEAGAATTNSESIAKKMRMLRDHGQAKKYYHDIEGYNGRLDSLQAGILSVKLRHLAEWNRKRQAAAQRYDEMLSSVEGVTAPQQPEWSRSVYHLYVVRVQDRAGLQKHLADAKIDTGIHYPVPLHLQQAYKHFGYKQGDFPVTEKVASEILSLPMYPQLEAEQQQRVVQKTAEFVAVGSLQ